MTTYKVGDVVRFDFDEDDDVPVRKGLVGRIAMICDESADDDENGILVMDMNDGANRREGWLIDESAIIELVNE